MITTRSLLVAAFALSSVLMAQAQSSASLQAQISALSNRISAQQVTIGSLQAQIAADKSNIASLTKSFTANQGVDTSQSGAISAIQVQLNMVKSNPALQLGPYVYVNANPENGVIGPNISFHGANIHIVSGFGKTEDKTTGLGNLIIGYDEVPLYPMAVQNGPQIGTVLQRLQPGDRGGSHNLIIGQRHRFLTACFGSLIAGESNSSTGSRNSVLGGFYNVAGGIYGSVVISGSGNIANGQSSVIAGGSNNVTTDLGAYSSILGGEGNTSNGEFANISGGVDNTCTGYFSVILGGENNAITTNSQFSTLLGGHFTNATTAYSVISPPISAQ